MYGMQGGGTEFQAEGVTVQRRFRAVGRPGWLERAGEELEPDSGHNGLKAMKECAKF